jgi:hypothetical protein
MDNGFKYVEWLKANGGDFKAIAVHLDAIYNTIVACAQQGAKPREIIALVATATNTAYKNIMESATGEDMTFRESADIVGRRFSEGLEYHVAEAEKCMAEFEELAKTQH